MDRTEVEFSVGVHTLCGSRILAVGAHPALGDWRPEHGLALRTVPQKYPVWSGSVPLPASALSDGPLEYKFVVERPDGVVVWEEGPNRQLPACSGEPAAGRFGGPAAPAAGAGGGAAGGGCEVTWLAVCRDTAPGDEVLVIGAPQALGAWCPEAALRLHTTPAMYPMWKGTARLPAGELSGPWKLAIRRPCGAVDWESGEDRCMELPADEESPFHIRVEFGSCADVAGVAVSPLTARTVLSPSPAKAYEAKPTPPTRRGDDPSTGDTGDGRSIRAFMDIARGHRASRGDSFSTVASEESASQTDPEEDDTSVSAAGAASPLPSTSDGEPVHWLRTGAHQLCKPGGRCEDAFFERPSAIGVADGVGQMVQFQRYGVDSAAYAGDLMCAAAMAFQPGGAAAALAPLGGPDAVACAAVAFAEGEAGSYGASTICVLCLQGGQLGVANLGDSGFMLLRRGEDGALCLVARSEEQQHSWNCPFQLLRVPPALQRKLPRGTRLDSAADCRRYRLAVYPGDLILAYTDGLSDNLHDHEVLEVVNREVSRNAAGGIGARPPQRDRQPVSASRIAKALALAAHDRSLDEAAEVPFCVTARSFGHRLLGGKTDDITVVAAWVTCEGAGPPAF